MKWEWENGSEGSQVKGQPVLLTGDATSITSRTARLRIGHN